MIYCIVLYLTQSLRDNVNESLMKGLNLKEESILIIMISAKSFITI